MKKTVLYISAVLIIVSCLPPPHRAMKPEQTTTSTAQNIVNVAMRPQFEVFHISDTISELHFKIYSKEVSYTRSDGSNFSSNILISYRLSPSYDSKEIMDSSSVRLVDINNNNADKYLIGKIKVKAKSPHSYFLHITVTDQNRNSKVTNVISVKKDNDLNRQNFLVKSKLTNAPLFRNYIKTGEEITINYKAKIAVNLYVRCYYRDFPLAAPPFSTSGNNPFQFKEDSVFVLQLSPEGSVNFTATKKGFYHFQLDSSTYYGVTLFNFSDVFPEVKKADDLVPPLRFITSRDEYDELSISANKKAAIEKFWLSTTSNQNSARDAIRKYYNRVQEANQNFTSYIEGWKTDRGMIYLIYGTPNVIYRTGHSETWIYGEENNINSFSFSFSKVDDPFTDNDFALQRSSSYQQSWFIAVDSWRQGRTY